MNVYNTDCRLVYWIELQYYYCFWKYIGLTLWNNFILALRAFFSGYLRCDLSSIMCFGFYSADFNSRCCSLGPPYGSIQFISA